MYRYIYTVKHLYPDAIYLGQISTPILNANCDKDFSHKYLDHEYVNLMGSNRLTNSTMIHIDDVIIYGTGTINDYNKLLNSYLFKQMSEIILAHNLYYVGIIQRYNQLKLGRII
jgi:hypothetical protein